MDKLWRLLDRNHDLSVELDELLAAVHDPLDYVIEHGAYDLWINGVPCTSVVR